MKSRSIYIVLTGIIITLMENCTKPYTPNAITTAPNYLVVEGIINTAGNDSTNIKLSRTVLLNSALTTNPEDNAVVAIQDDNNQSFPLTETGPGIYKSGALNLTNTHKYRLSINTTDGKAYLSDYIAPIPTPPIDSIGFTIKSDGLQIYANTHDPKNSTHYYRWDYTETWEFHSKYISQYVTDGTQMLLRTQAQSIYQCWGNSISTDIVLGSSAKLTQDVIYQNPIIFIESNSEKIEAEYSILLKQYALSADGYNYFDQLRKNTEQLGSIFDPQPSQLTGNIHCTTDAKAIAIGYITAGTIQQKRVFIDNSQVPFNWVPKYPYDCVEDTALYHNPKTGGNDVLRYLIPLYSSNLATEPIFSPGAPPSSPSGFKYADIDCVDCSIRGTTTKPAFWK